ncbi:MAG: hypothetical protein DMG47_07700 [Acidobacteria bacterium]|nr:MAG: hypothetical protein DMG47_07700 [Acidobacteriota bacterium]
MTLSFQSAVTESLRLSLHGAIRHTYALGPQQVRFRVSRGGSIKSVRSLRSSANLSFQQQSDIVSFEVPGIADYEVISLVANR